MESQAFLVNGGASNGVGFVSYTTGLEEVINGNGMFQVGSESGDEKKKWDLAEEVLEDFEEYWGDINDRLIISRMVSDSIIKGIVTAVEKEAAEKIASKDLELANLKDYLQSHEVGGIRTEDVKFPVLKKTQEVGNCGSHFCFTNACMKHEKMREEVHALRNLAREQCERVKKEVEFVRASNSVKRIGSGSELVGLGGILQEKQSESWMHVDKMLEYLRNTVDDVCMKVDGILLSSKISLCELQQEQNLSEKLEGMVIDSVLRSLQEEFDEKLWEQNARHFENQNVNWLEMFNEVSGLGNQLDAIVKSLSIPDTGLVSHGSHDLDHLLHHKAFSNHDSPTGPLFGENGTLDASNIHVALQQKTEEYFRLKREYLKERISFLTHGKDEFDMRRKKIPEVILRLEDFFLENERFPLLSNNLEYIGKLKHRLDSLLSENCHLRDRLSVKKNEVKCLEAPVSDAAAKSLEHSLYEERMLKLMENLKLEVEDSCIEASLIEEVYKCALRGQISQICCDSEDSCTELLITREITNIILRETAISEETANKFEYEDSVIEPLIMQELSGIILREAIKDAGQELDRLYQECQINKDIIICFEKKYFEKENELRVEVEEEEKLKQEILDLGTEIKQKEKLAMDLSISLSKEREQLKQASIELCSLREHADQLQILVSERNRELELLRSQHLEALEHIKVGKMEMQNLNQVLYQTKETLMEANNERNTALCLNQQMHDKLLSREAKEAKLKTDMKMAVNGLYAMFDDFQWKVSEAITRNTSRMVTVLKRTALMYNKKLERSSADLQMAEAEVDLLGDEVDVLLRLLKKIYIALDHYSPILKHYPGITETLELVRRELRSKSTKLQ